MKCKVLLFFCCISFLSQVVSGQANLSRRVSTGMVKKERLYHVLNGIAKQGKFSFAYNSNTVPADSLITIDEYSGTIFELLNQILGNNYEFKEVPGYIILRHAPFRMELTAEAIEQPGEQLLIRGRVIDAANQRGVKAVSIYERMLLISTLTNDGGYFEMRLPDDGHSINVLASRESYRDTTINLLRNVNVRPRSYNRAFAYFPISINKLEQGFGKLFISSKQMIQNLNLGGFFAFSPYQVSLAPGLSTHGMYTSQVINHFSLNLIGGYTAGVNGAEIGGLFNIDRNNVSSVQVAGLFNLVGNNVEGVQVAGLFNEVYGSISGVQIAGGLNKTEQLRNGLQIGSLNISHYAKGIQIGGLSNTAKLMDGGIQLAGFFNRADSIRGMQVSGFVNYAAEEGGPQFAGLINIAKNIKGFQFAGLVNIADSSDYPIGLLNFIKKGKKSISLGTDERFFSHLDFRSGGRKLYGLVGGGYKWGGYLRRYSIDLGLGIHLLDRKKFHLDAEYINQVEFQPGGSSYQINTIKSLAGIGLSRAIRLYAGPSLNLFSGPPTEPYQPSGLVIHHYITNSSWNTINLGMTCSLQLCW